MVYSYISAKEIIARIDNRFTIDHSDWIGSSPLWIADCLAQLKLIGTWQDAHEEREIVAHQGTLPCNVRSLIAIDYNGERMNCITKVVSPFYERNTLFTSGETYELHNLNNIITSFEEGTVTVLFKRPPIEYWQEHNIYLPIVPNDPFVIDAIEWFIILRILQKGTKHPIFNLRDQNPFTNPGIAYEKAMKQAKNSVNIMNPDQREEVSVLLRTLLNDINYHNKTSYPITTMLGTTTFSLIDENTPFTHPYL